MSVPDERAVQLSCREDHRQLPGLERQARVVAPQVSPKIFAAPHQLRDVNHDGKGAGVRNIAALSDKRIKNGLLLLRNAVASCQGYSCHGILPHVHFYSSIASVSRLQAFATCAPGHRSATSHQGLGSPLRAAALWADTVAVWEVDGA